MNEISDRDFALYRALRGLAREEAPPVALWPRIAAALQDAAPAASPRPRLPALAAALLLGCGLGLLLPLWLRQAAPSPDATVLRQALRQLDTAQASLEAAQRLLPHASYITELRVHSSLERASLEQRLRSGHSS